MFTYKHFSYYCPTRDDFREIVPVMLFDDGLTVKVVSSLILDFMFGDKFWEYKRLRSSQLFFCGMFTTLDHLRNHEEVDRFIDKYLKEKSSPNSRYFCIENKKLFKNKNGT